MLRAAQHRHLHRSTQQLLPPAQHSPLAAAAVSATAAAAAARGAVAAAGGANGGGGSGAGAVAKQHGSGRWGSIRLWHLYQLDLRAESISNKLWWFVSPYVLLVFLLLLPWCLN